MPVNHEFGRPWRAVLRRVDRAPHVLATLALGLIAACSMVWLVGSDVSATTSGGDVFEAGCDELWDFYRTEGLRRFEEGSPVAFNRWAFQPEEAEAEEASGSGDSQATPAPIYEVPPADLGARSETGTNIQVAGVDESDIIKTDGRYLYFFRRVSLRPHLVVAESVDGGIQQVAALALSPSNWSAENELLLAGDRLLIIRRIPVRPDVWGIRGAATQLVEVDISDPTEPHIVRALDTGQEFVSARLVGDEARVVLTTGNRLDFWVSLPELARESIEQARLWHWAPTYVLRNFRTHRLQLGLLTPCAEVARLEDAPDVRTTTLLTLDLSRGIYDWRSAAVVADAGAVYATTDSLYVSTANADGTSEIHYFSLGDERGPKYVSGTTLDGELINQFALSEWDGHLRVATVRSDGTAAGLVNKLTIFAVEDELRPVSEIDDIAPGESLRAARFLGEIGFLLTFPGERATGDRNRGGFIDPLFLLDLSDPQHPRVTGELDATGFSTYLHPLGGDLLLGIGPLTDHDDGERLALQASLFDVSEMTAPTLLDRVVISADASTRPLDHRSFSYRDGVAVIATGVVDRSSDRSGEGELIAVRVTPQGLRLAAVHSFPNHILRTITVGDQLHALSHSRLGTFALPDYQLLSSGRLGLRRDQDGRLTYVYLQETTADEDPVYAGKACELLHGQIMESALQRQAALTGVAPFPPAEQLDVETELPFIVSGPARSRTNPADRLPESNVVWPDNVQITAARVYKADFGSPGRLFVRDFVDTRPSQFVMSELNMSGRRDDILVGGKRLIALAGSHDNPTLVLGEYVVDDADIAHWILNLEIDGRLHDGWMYGGHAYVAFTSNWTGLPFVAQRYGRNATHRIDGSLRLPGFWSLGELGISQVDANAAFRYDAFLIQNSSLRDWLPVVTLTEPVAGPIPYQRGVETTERRLPALDCEAAHLSPNALEPAWLSVLAFDLSSGLNSWKSSSVQSAPVPPSDIGLAVAQESAYVAVSDVVSPNETTTLHEFALSDGSGDDHGIAYRSSATVPGRLADGDAIHIRDRDVLLATALTSGTFGRVLDAHVLSGFGRTGELPLAGSAKIDGERAYANDGRVWIWGEWGAVTPGCGDCGFALIDVSDTAQPVVVTEFAVSDRVHGVWPLGTERLLVHSQGRSDHWSRVIDPIVHLFDTSNPAQPKLLAEIDVQPTGDPYVITERDVIVPANRRNADGTIEEDVHGFLLLEFDAQGLVQTRVVALGISPTGEVRLGSVVLPSEWRFYEFHVIRGDLAEDLDARTLEIRRRWPFILHWDQDHWVE